MTETGWATAYHETIADFRRELIASHLAYEQAMGPYRDQVFASRGKQDRLPRPVLDAYTGLMMAGGYSYALAAVLQRAERLDPEVARKLAALAGDLLQNGGREEICADVWDEAKAAVTPGAYDGPCCTGCGPGCACGGSPHEEGQADD